MSQDKIEKPSRIGIVDSTTVAQVGQAFDLGNERLYGWARESLSTFTTLLITSPTQYLAPSPLGKLAGAHGLWEETERALRRMSAVISHAPEDASKLAAQKETLTWASRYQDDLKAAYKMIADDATNGQHWLIWIRNNQWVQHAKRLGHLFEECFHEPIATAMGLNNPKDLEPYWKKSATWSYVEDLVKHPESEDAKTMQQAFLYSTLLRGVYYDFVAHIEGLHMEHHPIRQKTILTSDSLASPTEPVGLGNGVLKFLSNIIIYSAMEQKAPSKRIQHWAGNVELARRAYLHGDIILEDVPFEGACIDYAAKVARDIGLDVAHPLIKRIAEILATISAGAAGWWVSSICLSPFPPILGAVGAAGVERATNVGYQVVKKKLASNRRMSDLAFEMPGRLF